ncbi:MAG: VanZ family protein [Propionibacteriaceae bacterium]|jgi:glycopeptide antibiotics resistance protein|nr:VanZ family protein [Propionibacteriaceae bacterium]
MKKAFSAVVVVGSIIYAGLLYYMLFRLPGRGMVVASESMLEHYNYWNSVNVVPFRTITQDLAAATETATRGHAIRNLAGNLFLLVPLGFILPFFWRQMRRITPYCLVVTVFIVAVEVAQLIGRSGSLDVDDFILNFTGALLGFLCFTRTPLRQWLDLRGG